MSGAIVLFPGQLLPRPSAASSRAGLGVAVEDGRVMEVAEAALLRARWPGAQQIELPDCLIMPGLVNAHQHGRGLSQVQLGYHDDYLETWIASRRGRGVLDAYAVTRLAAARMLANGVTCTVHANYSYGSGDYESELRAQLAAYDEVGIRVAMCVGAMDRGQIVYPPHEACFMAGLPGELQQWLNRSGAPLYARDAASTIALMARLQADFRGHPRIGLCYGPAGPQWVSEATWSALASDAGRRGIGLHLHALESPAQQAVAKELFPGGVFAWLEKLGAMTPRTVIAHGVWANDADMEIIARTGATVVRNPGCNLRLRNGIAPMVRYLAHGVRLAIGTDNASLADDEDLLAELRLAANLAREPRWDAPPPPSVDQLLAMTTVNGAVAAQFAPEVGTLEAGKRADLVAISLVRTCAPYLDPDMPLVAALLARARGSDVRLTMVDGRILYRDGRLTGLDMAEIEQAAADAARRARLPADAASRERAQQLDAHLRRHYRAVSDSPSRSGAG